MVAREELLENWLRTSGISDEFIALTLNWRTEMLARSNPDPDDQTILSYARAVSHKNVERYRELTVPPLSSLHVDHAFLCTLQVPWWKLFCAMLCAMLVVLGILVGSVLMFDIKGVIHVWR